MKPYLFFVIVLLASFLQCFPQADSVAIRQTTIQMYYQLAMQYKDGNGVKMDYRKAYAFFDQAARLGDVQSSYSLGYMLYKGFGCTQDYAKAADLFLKGAQLGKDNSMYFLGLCFRNGYGLPKNEDSAKYWFRKADSIGYPQAAAELNAPVAENSNDSAKALVEKINNAATPEKALLNKFTLLSNGIVDDKMIKGQYAGWLIQYDWSGLNVVSVKRLLLSISEKNNKLSGTWLEGNDTAFISAELKSNELKFNHTKYKRKDHYSPDNAIAYDFEDAKFNMIQQGDSLFLAGNISMFSPDRNEPSKPLFVALARKLFPDDLTLTSMTATPNPFINTLNVNFRLGQASYIEVQLISVNGAVIYRNSSGVLQPGSYLLAIQPGSITAGEYFLNLVYGNHTKVIKVIKSY